MTAVFETQLSNNIHISTFQSTTDKYVVRILIPGVTVRDHVYDTPEEAGEAISGLKEFYTYFGI